MKSKFKPNTVLPKGAKLIKPIAKKIGSWVDSLRYDAKLLRRGITWYRVQGGFGQDGRGEGWVADIPSRCVSVCDYNWNDLGFSINYGSFENAVDTKIEKALHFANCDVEKLEQKLADANEAVEIIMDSIGMPKKPVAPKRRKK